MATRTAADLLVDRLIDWGVTVVFGLPGDGINGLMEALRTRQDKVSFVQVRHEEAAAFMACGYAKYTGRLGVCLATSGPGAIHLLNGLYDAKMDGAPVLALTGQTYHDLIGTHYQQEVDLVSLYKDVSVFDQQVTGAAQVRSLVDGACRTALSARGVAHICFPVDLQEQPEGEDEASEKNVENHSSNAWRPPVVVPREDDLRAAAAILAAGSRTVILAGQGALGAVDELERAADLLGAPIVKPLLGKATVPDDSPFTTGGIGLLGTAPSETAMEQCDTLLMVGTSFPYMEFYPKADGCRGVQIDRDPTRLGLRFPVDVGLCGDARATLQALLPMLRRREDRSFLEQAQQGMKEWRELMSTRAHRDDVPLKPQVVAATLNDLLAPDAIVSTDSGTITTWVARYIDIKRRQLFSCSGNLATMAPGLPYSIAAQVAYPGRQSVAFVGDGGFTMLMGEFATAVKYRLPIKVVIIKNNALGQIKWEQMVFLGNPEYGVQLEPIDFVRVAEACGAVGFRCERPDEVRPALEAMLLADGPALCEAVVDPFEPPMPARVKVKQAIRMGESLARGEPNRGRIALTLFRDKISDLSGGR
ncbi:MAG TPA: thiamine pyrophosphate-dependent enzyme [Vicinamibacterales bacterium]|nr:thiamine pyrophosphate-dependent enzyme [Vicinamibacterales bacterium]